MENNIFVAADLGTSYIMLMAAERTEEGLLHVLALERDVTPAESIQNGVVKKPTDLAIKIKELVAKLENRIENKLRKKYKIDSLYISVNGRSMRTIRANVKRSFSKGTEITSTDLKQFRTELKNKQRDEDRLIYDMFEEEYLIDGDLVHQAEGIICSEIMSNYIVVLGRPELKENLDKCFEKLKLEHKSYTLSPLIVADSAATEEDKQRGCAVIDFGAATTTIVVFQEGYIRHIVVVPFGGKHITNDLKTYLDLTFPAAEKIKITTGIPEKNDDIINKTIKLSLPGAESRILKKAEIVDVIEARLSEIVDLCMSEINLSHYGDKLNNGLIIVGGASKLKNLVHYMSQKTSMPVRLGSVSSCLDEESKTDYSNNEYALLIGQLVNATDPCATPVADKEQEVPSKGGIKKKGKIRIFTNFVEGLFPSEEVNTIED